MKTPAAEGSEMRLAAAAEAGDLEKVEEGGAARTAALVQACREGHADVVRALLQAGADVDGDYREDIHPLMSAAAAGHLEVVRLLLETGARTTDHKGSPTALTEALVNKHLEVARAILNVGYGDVAVCMDPCNCDHGTWTALTAAAQAGDAELLRGVLDWGADINGAIFANQTALMVAAENCHVEVVNAVLQAGADVDVRVTGGRPRSSWHSSGLGMKIWRKLLMKASFLL